MRFNRWAYVLLGSVGILLALGYYLFATREVDTPASSDKQKNWREQFHAAHDNAPPPPIPDDLPQNDAEQKVVEIVTKEIEGEATRLSAALKQRGIVVSFQNGLSPSVGEHIIGRSTPGRIFVRRRKFYESDPKARGWRVLLDGYIFPDVDPTKLREEATRLYVTYTALITRYDLDDCQGIADTLRSALAARKENALRNDENDLATSINDVRNSCASQTNKNWDLSDGTSISMFLRNQSTVISVTQREKLSALMSK